MVQGKDSALLGVVLWCTFVCSVAFQTQFLPRVRENGIKSQHGRHTTQIDARHLSSATVLRSHGSERWASRGVADLELRDSASPDGRRRPPQKHSVRMSCVGRRDKALVARFSSASSNAPPSEKKEELRTLYPSGKILAEVLWPWDPALKI